MAPRRGRPPKFGRAARLVALTLPQDVLAWLRARDPDPARAIVALCEAARGTTGDAPNVPLPQVDIALLTPRRGLIVVDRRTFGSLAGVALIPLSTTHAFLALEPDCGLPDLELAVLDRLDEESIPDTERALLTEFRRRLREWRKSPHWRFERRAIIVAEQKRSAPR